MLASRGERTPPCGVPTVVGLKAPFSITPERRNFSISRRMLPSATFSATAASVQRSVGEVVEGLPDPRDRERLECREDETPSRSCGYNDGVRGAAQRSPP